MTTAQVSMLSRPMLEERLLSKNKPYQTVKLSHSNLIPVGVKQFLLTDGQTNDSGWLAPDTYSVSEIVDAGWNSTSSCTMMKRM